jgi:hypothetical protein
MAWPVVEDGLRLDVHRVVRAGKKHGGPFRWQWTGDGEVTGSISITVTFDSTTYGRLALRYNSNGELFDQLFQLEAEACRFGGQRWFALCPVTRRRASKLYSLGGAGFHARHRYGRVAYRTQRAPKPIDRVLMRRDRILVRKLKSDDPEFVPKPKWMRWKTYDRWKAQLDWAEEQCDVHLVRLMARLEAYK